MLANRVKELVGLPIILVNKTWVQLRNTKI